MSSGLDKTPKDEAKGFAGLSSMVSDVGDAPSIEKRDVEPEPSRGASQPVEEAAKKTEPQPQPQPRAIYQDPPKSNDGGFQGKWLIGIAVVVGLVWLASSSGKKSPEYPPAYSTSTNSAPAKVDSPTWQPPISDVQVPTKPSEETPPVGTGLVLSQPQIRYCSAESIRLNYGHVGPDMAYWAQSGEFIFIALMGGTSHVAAAFLGSAVFEVVRTYALEFAPNAWRIILGSVLVVIICFLPKGLWSLTRFIKRKALASPPMDANRKGKMA